MPDLPSHQSDRKAGEERPPSAERSGSFLVDLMTVLLIGSVSRLPRRLVMRFGGALARFAGLFLKRKTRRIRENLVSAGIFQPDQVARRAWSSMGATFMEMLWILGRTPQAVLADVEVIGVEELEVAGQQGRGVLLVSGHIGNWELVPLCVAQAGLKMAVVAREMSAPALEERIIAFREKGQVRTLVREKAGTSVTAYRWLHRGDVLGSMMDRLSAGRRLKVPLLGRFTNMPVAPAVLACRTGAAVVLGCARRRPDGSSAVVFRRVGDGPFKEPEDLLHAVAAALDADLRQHPEEWFWIYRSQPL